MQNMSYPLFPANSLKKDSVQSLQLLTCVHNPQSTAYTSTNIIIYVWALISMQAICSQCRKLLVCYANLSLSTRFTVCSYLWVRITNEITNDFHLSFTLIAAMSLVGCWRGLLGAGLVPTGGPPGTNLAKR